jgi:hypothetical protein
LTQEGVLNLLFRGAVDVSKVNSFPSEDTEAIVSWSFGSTKRLGERECTKELLGLRERTLRALARRLYHTAY